jgi:hypothetical protein
MATPPFGLAVRGLAIPEHDFVTLTYSDANVVGIVYRSGGVNGLVVTTLTLSYDGSSNLTTIAKS